jgi:hypothetical protein
MGRVDRVTQRRAVRRAAAQALATPRYEDTGYRSYGRSSDHDDWAEALADTGPIPVVVPVSQYRTAHRNASSAARVTPRRVATDFQPLRVVDNVSATKTADKDEAADAGFEPLDVDETMFGLRSRRWYRRKPAVVALLAVAAVASVAAVVLVVLSRGDGAEQTTTVTPTPSAPAPAVRAPGSVVPPPPVFAPPPPVPSPSPPPAPAPPPVSADTGQGSYPSYMPPSQSGSPQIGVTRTPATRAPISVAPSPQPAAEPPDKHKRGGGWHF